MAKNSDFLKDFVEEALVHVESAEVGLLKLENGEGDADIIHSIFRNLHSIKGTASFFSLKNIVSLSHAMENLFGEIRNGNLVIDEQMIDVLLSANDCLKQMIMDVENSEVEDISEHTARITKALNSKSEGQQSESSPGPATAKNHEGFFSADIDIDKEEIQEAARRGQRFYRIRIEPGDNPPELLKK